VIGVNSSGRSFRALAQYLESGRSGAEHVRVGWIASRNLPTEDPQLVAKIMRATAAQNLHVGQPVYHLALSFDRNDAVDRATMERVTDHVLEALKLTERQVLIVAHRDREHAHMHLLVNRVHPETGLAWDRWQDQRIVQEVLRAEEQALGLRIVRGRLAGIEERAHTPAVEKSGSHREKGRRQKPNAGLEGHYDRVKRLTTEQLENVRGREAAHSRATRLESAAARAQAADDEFRKALTRVYRDPAETWHSFSMLAGERGAAEASRMMRDRPEQFGMLLTRDAQHAFGLVRRQDDKEARIAAAFTATKGREAVEAEQALHQELSDARARRLDDVFMGSLSELYTDPRAARSEFLRLVALHGAEQAASVLATEPETLAHLRTPMDSRADLSVEALAASTAAAGLRAVEAKTADVQDLATTVRTALDEARISRTDMEAAVHREKVIRHELRSLPALSELEWQIARGADAMVTPEARTVKRAVTAPKTAATAMVKRAIRDAVVGRDDEREQ